jgi:small subunit ribosomal protein S24e
MIPMAEVKITSDRRNELLKRRELSFTLGYTGSTPSRSEVMGKVCAVLSLDEKKVVLDSVRTRFGERMMDGIARVYDDEDGLAKTERPYLMARSRPKAEKKGPEPGAAKATPKEAAKAAPKEPAKEAPREAPKPAREGPAKGAGA